MYVPFDMSEIGWLNATNAALGIVVAVFFGLIGVGAAWDLLPRLWFRLHQRQMDAEVRHLLSQCRM